MVLIRPTDDGDPVGRRIDVSKDTSTPSGSPAERIDGDGCRIDDSYDISVEVAHP